MVNQSADLGVKDDRDKAVRELFRNVKFRRALSQAMDRDGITQAIMRGPFLRAWPGGVYPGSPEFDQKSVVYYPYGADTAKALLAELGFKDTDNNGILNWTTGPLSGQDLILSLRASQDAIETVNIGEALVYQWGKPASRSTCGRPRPRRRRTKTTPASGTCTSTAAARNLRCRSPTAPIAPVTKNQPHWHREGDKPRSSSRSRRRS